MVVSLRNAGAKSKVASSANGHILLLACSVSLSSVTYLLHIWLPGKQIRRIFYQIRPWLHLSPSEFSLVPLPALAIKLYPGFS